MTLDQSRSKECFMNIVRFGLIKASVLGALCAIGFALAPPAHADGRNDGGRHSSGGDHHYSGGDHRYGGGDRHYGGGYNYGHRSHSSFGIYLGGPGYGFGYRDGYWGGPRYYTSFYYPSSYYDYDYDPYYYRPVYSSYSYGYYPRHHYYRPYYRHYRHH